MTDAKIDPRGPDAGPDSKTPALDSGMNEKEKDAMSEQMEELEGPDRREIRGDNSEPAEDPGVANS